MHIIESILRPYAVAALALSAVLGAFGPDARAGALSPSDIIDREVEIAVQYVHELNYTEALKHYEKALSDSIRVNGKQHGDVARYKNDIGVVYLKMGKYKEARDILMQAAGIAGKKPDDPNAAAIYRNLGATFYNLDELEKALDWHRKASAASGAKRPDAVGVYGNIASIFDGPGASEQWCSETLMIRKLNAGVERLNAGEYAKARNVLMQAAEIGGKVLNDINSSNVALVYGNLGAAFYRLGDYEKALGWYQKALAIQENIPGANGLDAAETYRDIASVHERQGHYQIALDWYVKAQVAQEKVRGANHPAVAALYDRIAAMHQLLDGQDKAQEWQQKATAVRDNAMDDKKDAAKDKKDAAGTVSAYRNAALAYSGQGDFGNALKSYEQALATGEKSLGKQHPVNTATRNDIAGVYDKKGDYKQAAIWYRKVLADQETVLGKGHPNTAATYSNIAVAEARSGDNKRALENLRKAVAIFEKTAGENHPNIATAYTNVAWVYSRMHDYDKAEEWARRATQANERSFGKNHPVTGMSYGNVATMCMNRKQYDKAVSGYLEAYRIYLDRFGDANPQTQSFRDKLERVYKLTGKSKPFGDWLSESLNGQHAKAGVGPMVEG